MMIDPEAKRTLKAVEIVRDHVWTILQQRRLPQYCEDHLRYLLAAMDNAVLASKIVEDVLEKGFSVEAKPIPRAHVPAEDLFSWDKHEKRAVSTKLEVKLQRRLEKMKMKLQQMEGTENSS